MSSAHRVGGNELTLLRNGAEYFPQLCAAIDAAQHSIHLETYIFSTDEVGRDVAAALRRAAGRGVAVCLLLDGYGSAELPESWVDDLRESGVEVHWFRREVSPFTLRRDRMRRLRRLHRKLVAVDGEIAFVGGINIVNDIPREFDFAAPRLDYAVRVQGELAGEVQAAMQHLWEMVSWAAFRKRVKSGGWRLRRSSPNLNPDLQLVLRDNVRHRRDIERAYVRAIAGAQREIIIASAYFLPGRSFLRALMQAVRRGVRVLLLLQGRAEYRLQHYATLALYDRLTGAGVEIYEYQPSHLHAKVAVIDGEWATVGSFNIDPFSLLLAREANLVVRDAGFAAGLRASLMQAIEQDGRRAESAGTGNVMRFLAWISYGLIRFAIGVSGISRKH
ncbi:MAG: cardiolipin synthase ClsB [Nitrosomonadales bacterium]|nr:cardiolipin synthase ClsB [Nitrosomonadales bacterium]